MAGSDIAYGRVVGRFMSFLADDGGDGPVEVPLAGSVALTPRVGVVRWAGTEPPRMAVMQTLVVPLVDGVLGDPEGGAGGVLVVASRQPGGEPDCVQWTASFRLSGVFSQPSPVTFEVPAGGVVDLSTIVPVGPVPGTVTVVSHADRVAAEAAAVRAEGAAGGVEADRVAAGVAAETAEVAAGAADVAATVASDARDTDRKSTRLNSSHWE